MTLKQMVEETDTLGGRVFDLSIQVLIFVSLVSFSIETLPDLSEAYRGVLRTVETITIAIFTAEYCLRWFVADQKLKFAFSFFGLVDLLAILPFYLATGLDLRSIRVLRFLRLARTLKLVRYSGAIRRFGSAFAKIKDELAVFLVATIGLIYVASVGIYYFENAAQPEAFKSIFHSLWWAVATLTTVGYGDVYPIIVGGRLFTFAILMLGLGVVAVPAGLLASALGGIHKADGEKT